MKKQKLIEINSAYVGNDIVEIKALNSDGQEVYIPLPTLNYFNRRDNDALNKDVESNVNAIWDIANDIASMGPSELQEVYGVYAPRFVFKNYSPYQAAGILLEHREKKKRKTSGIDYYSIKRRDI